MAVKGQAVCHDATESDLDWMSEEDDFINLDFSTSGENQVASGVEDSCLILDVNQILTLIVYWLWLFHTEMLSPELVQCDYTCELALNNY